MSYLWRWNMIGGTRIMTALLLGLARGAYMDPCIWTPSGESYGHTIYETGCGQEHIFEAGPREEGFKFCPYCGRALALEEVDGAGPVVVVDRGDRD